MSLAIDQFWLAERPNPRSVGSGILVWVKTTDTDGELQFSDGDEWQLVNPSASGFVTLEGTETLSNKTITTPRIALIKTNSGAATITLPTSTDTLVGRDTTDTLTNKTLTTPVIASIKTNGGASTLTLPTSTDTIVGRATTDTLTNKTLTTPTIAAILTNAGAATLTLPTSTDTLVGRATTDTLTNKTLTTPVIASIKTNAGAATLTLPTTTDTMVGRATTDTLTNKTMTSPAINGGTITTALYSDVQESQNYYAHSIWNSGTSYPGFLKSSIQSGTLSAPYTNNGGLVPIPGSGATVLNSDLSVQTGFDFYGPKMVTNVSISHIVGSDCCIADDDHGAGEGILGYSWIPEYHNYSVSGEGVGAVYGAMFRLDDFGPMEIPDACVHGSTFNPVQTPFLQPLTAIANGGDASRLLSTNNLRSFYGETNVYSNAGPISSVVELTIRHMPQHTVDATVPGSSTGAMYGLVLEMGRFWTPDGLGADTITGKYGSAAIHIAGDATVNGSWLTGINFVAGSLKDYGIDFGRMQGGVLPSVGLIRFPNLGVMAARTAAGADQEILKFNVADVLTLYAGTVQISASAASIAGDLNVTGFLTMTGAAKRIYGDFSTATVANRVLFQTLTADGATVVGAIPGAGGSGTVGAFVAYNNATPASATQTISIETTSGDSRLSVTGTGGLKVFVGSEQLRIIPADGVIDYRNSQYGTGSGGAAATLRTMGDGSTTGPGTAAQTHWVKFKVGGTLIWLPGWS